LTKKTIQIVAHSPSKNMEDMRQSIVKGAQSCNLKNIKILCSSPFDISANDVLRSDGIILGTTENFGYMNGALKDFFERIYYPCQGLMEGRPYMLFVRAGNDGVGAKKSVEAIAMGLKWRKIQEPLICRGPWNLDFLISCEELGKSMALGLDMGIY
jgi:multimeric flavodoxin WrbA